MIVYTENLKKSTKKLEQENFARFQDTDQHLKINCRASLVVQWLRIHLPMQGTRVQALVWEDPTCHGATGPVSQNY